ncbi:MAG: hypothetical protein B6I30_06595 [Desulfobacteraceae bacterium 4572_187]|nr:MAG: hypothetical protein B6I30_06595 [Desulfobacteraceae bacterium 4572_187]
MVKQNKPPVYILDTSVLFTYLAGQADYRTDREDSFKHNQIKSLFEKETVVIPIAALVEMLGQFFHEKIDLENYDIWYRNRRAVFSSYIINHLYNSRPPRRVSVQQKHAGMNAIQMGFEKISKQAVEKLSRNYATKKTKYEREPKLLDGADASIVSEAVIVAKDNENRPCYLLSGDIWMSFAVEDIRRRAEKDDRFPKNLEFLKIWDIGKKLKTKPAGKRRIVREMK